MKIKPTSSPHQRVAPEKYQLIIGREIAMHYAHLNKRLIFELVCSKKEFW